MPRHGVANLSGRAFRTHPRSRRGREIVCASAGNCAYLPQRWTGRRDDMNSTNMLKLAAVLGAICGLVELYEAATFVEDIRRGSTNVVRGVFIFIMPLVIVAGAVGVYFERVVIGAGTMLVGIGIQHYLIDMAPRHFIPVAIGLAGIFLAMYVQSRRDAEELKDVPREHITVLPS
jgi:hypothetical protein